MRLWFGDQLAVPALETMLPLRASAGSGGSWTTPFKSVWDSRVAPTRDCHRAQAGVKR
jgi:hypothetical protein